MFMLCLIGLLEFPQKTVFLNETKKYVAEVYIEEEGWIIFDVHNKSSS